MMETLFYRRGWGYRRSRNERDLSLTGFTLVEVLVSAIILSLLAAGLFSVFVSARYLVARSKQRFAAAQVARQEIERKRFVVAGDTWDSGPLAARGQWGYWDGSAWVSGGWDSATYAPYRFRYRVDDPGGGVGYRRMTVDVRWNETSI